MAVAATERHSAAARRRLMYGVNVAVSVVLAGGLLGLVVYLAQAFGGQVDLTASGVNSLSPYTKKMLRTLDKPIHVSALYTVLTEYDKIAQKRQKAVADLLTLYESASSGKVRGRVVDPMKDQTAATRVLESLKNKPAYKDETAGHAAALAGFPELSRSITALLNEESDRLAKVPPEFAADKLAIVARNFQAVTMEAGLVDEKVTTLLQAEVPGYGQALSAVRAYLPRVQGLLTDARAYLEQSLADRGGVPAEVREVYGGAGQRYADVLARIEKTLADTQELEKKPVRLEELYRKLRNWPTSPVILVETDADAKALDLEEVWPHRSDPNAPLPEDGDERVFAGERAVSSAILQLTQKEKTAVVFTHWGGTPPLTPDFRNMNPMMMRQMPRAPFQQVNKLLQDANFVTSSWDVQQDKKAPVVEGAARTIYVVMRPEPPQQNMMQPQPEPGISPADKQLILDAVSASGRALFLCGWSAPASQMEMITGAREYEFNDYLKNTWGMLCKSKYLTVVFQPNPEKPGLWVPRRGATTVQVPDNAAFTNHEIGAELRSVVTALTSVAPLEIDAADKRPAGVEVRPVIETLPSDDLWAIADVSQTDRDLKSKRGTAPTANDILSVPKGFPVAAAGENKQGQRVVVISSEDFATDAQALATGLAVTGRGLAEISLAPGNVDLLVNSLHWLAGNADRIAAGTTTGDVPRLSRLRPGATADFWRYWFLPGIWPGAALAAGVAVWFFRRR